MLQVMWQLLTNQIALPISKVESLLYSKKLFEIESRFFGMNQALKRICLWFDFIIALKWYKRVAMAFYLLLVDSSSLEQLSPYDLINMYTRYLALAVMAIYLLRFILL